MAVLVPVLVVSGCGGINSTGTVSPLMFIQRGNGNPALERVPAQPSPGASLAFVRSADISVHPLCHGSSDGGQQVRLLFDATPPPSNLRGASTQVEVPAQLAQVR